MSETKTFARSKLQMWIKKIEIIFERAEDIVGQAENAGYQNFLFHLHYLQKISLYWSLTPFQNKLWFLL